MNAFPADFYDNLEAQPDLLAMLMPTLRLFGDGVLAEPAPEPIAESRVAA